MRKAHHFRKEKPAIMANKLIYGLDAQLPAYAVAHLF
jgi:hypothetical protein